MRQLNAPRGCPYLFAFGLLGLALAAGPGCNQDLSKTENSSPVVLPDSEEGKKALASAEAFVKLREAQESKAKARAVKRKKGFPEEGESAPTPAH